MPAGRRAADRRPADTARHTVTSMTCSIANTTESPARECRPSAPGCEVLHLGNEAAPLVSKGCGCMKDAQSGRLYQHCL
eukprot:32085-Chlamydomonas_euryale.AAC.5